MNTNFIKKMLLAKQLEYEAIKEIMPERVRNRVEDIESNTKKMLKEIAIDLLVQTGQNGDKGTSDTGKRSNKVNVDFEE